MITWRHDNSIGALGTVRFDTEEAWPWFQVDSEKRGLQTMRKGAELSRVDSQVRLYSDSRTMPWIHECLLRNVFERTSLRVCSEVRSVWLPPQDLVVVCYVRKIAEQMSTKDIGIITRRHHEKSRVRNKNKDNSWMVDRIFYSLGLSLAFLWLSTITYLDMFGNVGIGNLNNDTGTQKMSPISQ